MNGGRTLIAGVGNVLRGDDGFGIHAARRLLERGGLPDGVRVIETGIGGISLVQELMQGWEALVVLDAVQGDQPAGTLSLRTLEVADLRRLPPREQQGFLADVHFANPGRALMLARALEKLPDRVYLLGCVASSADGFGTGLSEPVGRAVDEAAVLLKEWLQGSLTWEEVKS